MPKSIPHADARIDEALNAVLDNERDSRRQIEQCERDQAPEKETGRVAAARRIEANLIGVTAGGFYEGSSP